MFKKYFISFCTMTFCLAVISNAFAAGFSIEKEDSGDIAFFIDGELFTRFVTSDTVTNKLYFWPIIGPTGTEMTRAYPMKDVKGEQRDHPHHRSLWFSMQNADGFDTWDEILTFTRNGRVNQAEVAKLGRQVINKVVIAEAEGNSATLVVDVDVVTPSGEIYLKQKWSVKFWVESNASRMMDFDIELIGCKDKITILGKKDSGLSIRVADSICVDTKKGGRMINSDGVAGEATWGKRASWMDFNGPVDEERVGVAILNHPDSFRYPTPWHARTYGLFTANPFALNEVAGEEESGDIDLLKGETIMLKHRIIFHKGDEKEAQIAQVWEDYIKE